MLALSLHNLLVWILPHYLGLTTVLDMKIVKYITQTMLDG